MEDALVDLRAWSLNDEPAEVIDLREPGALRWLADRYGSTNPRVVQDVLGQAYALGAQTVVIEYRYIDADYRNEHTGFYSTTFRRYPSVTNRLHFFAQTRPDALLAQDEIAQFGDLGYLGYAVMRPVPGAPVGRVMLKPPPALEPFVTCLATDTVNLLGEQLSVTAAPFIAQDAQLLRCAHATLWVTAYLHHLRWRGPRLLPRDIADAVPAAAGLGRAIPSPGLTLNQMSAASSSIGLPPLVYELAALPPGESLFRIACRYLNSGMPVIVAGGGHAFVLVGYERVDAGTPDERIRFIRQDDETGPYQIVDNYQFDAYSPWEFLLVPLPNKLYLSGEEAEVLGSTRLQAAYQRIGQPLAKHITFHSTAMLSNDFKIGLEDRGMPSHQAAIYRRMAMSRWIWVVEAIDRSLREAGDPSVIAEAVVDATDHARDRHVLAWRYGASLSQWIPDFDLVRSAHDLPLPPPLPSVSLGSG